MNIFPIVFVISTFLCTLVAGFLFAFAVVVMPGINKLKDRDFIRAFQVIDGIIQKNQPLFMLLWLGSILFIIACLILGVGQLDGVNLIMLICAAAFYLLGVQLSTIIINIPLNNNLQSLDVTSSNEKELKSARDDFETRWNYWNISRTIMACLVSALLVILLFRL